VVSPHGVLVRFYGPVFVSSEPLIARVALHAAYLQFVHPRSGESASINCKLPPDFSIWFGSCRDQAVRAGESAERLAIETKIAVE
jgi:hypothetical protein